MPKRLFVCPSCKCHVKEGDPACPFCGSAVQARREPEGAVGHLSRIALVAMSTAVAAGAVATVGCSDPEETAADTSVSAMYGGPPVVDRDGGDGGDPFMAGDAYGVPPMRDGGDGGNPFMAGDAYGVPPVDGGRD